MTPSSGASSILPFKFRPRRETVDWRRINAVDVDLVASRLDVDTLQEHINTVTFCSLEGERCQRCQSPVDPILIKLLRLAQLTVEWVLHCQEVLAMNLQAAEEKLEARGREKQEMLEQQNKQEEKVKTMAAELKQRKKIIRTQQSLLVPRIISGQKCVHCEKSFLNSMFLQSHMQRRHPEEYQSQLRSDSENKSVIENLRTEISSQKEQITQLQQTLQAKTAQCIHCEKTFLSSTFLESHIQRRHPEELESQLRSEIEKKSVIENLRMENINQREQIAQLQQSLQAKNTLENELQSMHKDLMKELERLKAEEMARNIQALNEANQNLTARHEKSGLPERDVDIYKDVQSQALQKLEQQLKKQDKRIETRLLEIKAQHESEKTQLQKELSRMQTSVSRMHQERSQWQQQQQEVERRLQEKEQTIQAQRKQMRSISSKPPTKVTETTVSTAAPEPKPKRVVLDSSSYSERRSVEKKPEPLRDRKQRMNTSALKKDPRMKKEIRKELEHTVLKKLENLGVKAEQPGLKKKELTSILAKIYSKRDGVASRMPDYWRHREDIASSIHEKMGGEKRGNNFVTEAQSGSRQPVQVLQIRPRSSSLPSRVTQSTPGPAVRQSKTPQPAPRTKNSSHPKTSTPNSKAAPRIFTTKTPPFSSDEESEDDDDQPQKHHGAKSPVQVKSSKSSPLQTRPLFSSNSQPPRGSAVTKTTVTAMERDEDDGDWSEVSELQEIDPGQLQSYRDQNGNTEKRSFGKENKINILARKMEQQLSQRSIKKPAGGVSILTERKDDVQDLTYTDLEESSDWVVSSLEDKPDKAGGSLQRKSQDSPSTSVWGTSTGKAPKSAGGTGSTLKSTLCSLSDISDTEDISN
ncbi:cilium assembly protein DZIP1 isoform X2 [Cynoglossus semilaevis]|nr:zinc finger protein Dzip1-like isoform X2 [Cynoglossus semilaevis]XP_008323533.1 zinc finger protein Dzip1-like isoform X2 [Cynoglossus semilaevis]